MASCGNDGRWKAWKTKGRFPTLPTALGRLARGEFPPFPQLRLLVPKYHLRKGGRMSPPTGCSWRLPMAPATINFQRRFAPSA